jgi:capsular exopolysaccharide synthesis family protein
MDPHVVSVLSPKSFEAEQYRSLRHAVEEMAIETDLRVLAVTSPGVQDGKTTTSVNLAATLAQRRDARILLIDADLRHGSVATALGLHQSPGLVDALVDRTVGVAGVVRRVPGSGLVVVPAGQPTDSTYELLVAPRLQELLAEARRGYDFVVVDTPPVLPLADFRVMEPFVDGVLVVVAAHRTPRKLLTEALHLLDPAKTRGLVFNGDDRMLSGYASYYAYYATEADGSSVRRRRWLGRSA